MSDKPNQFWLYKNFTLDGHDAFFDSPITESYEYDDTPIHVIEHSAYQALQSELEKVKVEFKELENDCVTMNEHKALQIENNNFRAELAAEKAKSEKLVKALTIYSQRTVWFKDGGQLRYKSGSTTPFFKDEEWCESDPADEALAAYKEKGK
jgi:hypothetical protein